VTREIIHQELTPEGRIQVWQEDGRRSLWFDDVILQSEIQVHDPAVLPNPANRAMLAHLMFGQEPAQVMLAGGGGGAIGRWFHARSPQTRGDAVERAPSVVRIARDYFDFPPAGSHWRQHLGDVREFLGGTRRRYDFILVDLEEEQYSPRWLTEPGFLDAFRRRLSDGGILTLNLIPGGPKHYARALHNIRRVFDRRTLCLPVPGHDNQLVLAFRAAFKLEGPALAGMDARIRAAGTRWGIDFAPHWKAILANNPVGSGIL
jgi:spermidine synthase